jgi:hypothetical protein
MHARSNVVDRRRLSITRTSGGASSRPLTNVTTDDSRPDPAVMYCSIPFVRSCAAGMCAAIDRYRQKQDFVDLEYRSTRKIDNEKLVWK